VLEQVGALSHARDRGPFKITERTTGKGHGGSITFEQVIRGVRYFGRNQIFVDEHGRISEVLLKTVDPQRAPAQVPMSRAQAFYVFVNALSGETHIVPAEMY
jgi:hypothetical protein